MRSSHSAFILLAGALCAHTTLLGCGADAPTSFGAPAPGDTAIAVTDFTISGDPASASGATWIYRATAGGVAYDMEGVLRKPSGNGPFPAVIISHGLGGSARAYSSSAGLEMSRWGLVIIATSYTHANGVPLGSPGLATERGASAPNVLRAQKLLDLLRSLGYVDMTRVAAHGHSMGAFVTAALVGASPNAFRAASHTAGGVRPTTGAGDAAAPTDAQAANIRVPYQMHHGDLDTTVPIAMDVRLDGILAANGVTRELVTYPGAGHNDVPFNAAMFESVRAWYTRHGMFK